MILSYLFHTFIGFLSGSILYSYLWPKWICHMDITQLSDDHNPGTFNAMKLLHQHFPAIMGAALESDIYCEAICDGRHLHPGTVRLLLKVKGLDRVVAITDSIMAAGLPDGKYKLGVNDVVVEDGDAKLAENGVRAGSTLTQNVALKNLLKFTGKSLEEILPLLTENPANLIKIADHKGFIADGMDADLVVLDPDFEVFDTFVGGRKVTSEDSNI